MPANDPVISPSARLNADKVRQIINRWSGSGFFRIARMGERITLNQVTGHSSYTIRLWSEYETRSVSRVSKPFQGGLVDDAGQPPDLWDISVRRPTDFEDRTETVPVPHTEQVETCSTCHGNGLVTCTTCHGTGRVNCTFCQGKGYRERTEMRSETGPGGTPTTRMVTVRDNCTCFNGRVNCGTCASRGEVQCSSCTGSGRVKTYEQLTVTFHVAERTEVLNSTQVPEDQMREVSGKVLLVKDGARIDNLSSITPAVDQAARTLLSTSHALKADTRLLQQRLRIEEVSVHEVNYWYGGPPLRQLWIFGDEERVHAPGAPWSWGRVVVVAAIGVGVLAAIAAALFFFLGH